MNEGERQALINQVTLHAEAAEKKIRSLGLPFVKIVLFDERTRVPIDHPGYLVEMAEGTCPRCGGEGKTHNDNCILSSFS